MDLEEKLQLLGGQAGDDQDGSGGSRMAQTKGGEPLGLFGQASAEPTAGGGPCGVAPRRTSRAYGITEVKLPGGGSMRLLRVMMTNICRYSCRYCAMRAGRKMKRASFQPEELAKVFLAAYSRGLCEGLFITSGIPGPAPRQMDKMLALAEILRTGGYAGYIHMKILPGAEDAQVERAAQLCQRISLNLEAASDEGLEDMAGEKKLTTDLLPRLQLAGRLARRAKQEPGKFLATAGTTSQFVVGASRDTDRDILTLVGRLYGEKVLHHAHFAAFQPVVDTPMEDRPGVPLLREHRLYQADYLFRLYGFRPDEIVFDPTGNVPLGHDPKVAWALAHPERFPLEIARAPMAALLRVPGIGRSAAEKILRVRREVSFRDLEDLRKIGVVTKRAKGFLTLNGRRLAPHLWEEQLDLMAVAPPAVAHALKTDDPPCAYR